MAKFTSRFLELGFYVDGVLKNFVAGQYVTEDKAEIEVLSALLDVERIDEEPKKAEEPAAKAPAKKASEK
jgi:hypothetical protein